MFLQISCHKFRMHNGFLESLVTRGLSPLPVCILDNEQLTFFVFRIGGNDCDHYNKLMLINPKLLL